MDDVVNNLVLFDVELREDRLVDQTSPLVVAALVERSWLFEEFENVLEDLGPRSEFVVAVIEQRLEFVALGGDPAEPILGSASRNVAVSDEVEQVLLLHVELDQLRLDVLLAERQRRAIVRHDVGNQVPHSLDEFGIDYQRPVVVFDRLFDQVGADVRLVALVLLLGCAEEVEVRAAVAVGALDYQPGLPTPLVAGAAPQTALEVVVVDSSPFAGGGSDLEDVLHPVEQLAADQRFVASLVLLALVPDNSDVIGLS